MRERLALKNSSIIFLCQVSDIILQFIVRKLFIMYIGIEMLGINGTFSSILAALSVAELGFEGAVIYSLYKPISENRKEVVEDIIVILKRIYTFVGIFILAVGLILIPFLPQILKGIEVNIYIYIVYYLQVMSVAITYFLGYKRTLLYALKLDYIRSIYISLYKLVAAILHIITIVTFSSYVWYVLIILAQNLLTNISLGRYCDRKFDYNFKNKKFNIEYFTKIVKDVKDIFWGKIAGYIYSSTDGLVISYFVGTISVGYLSNYTQIFLQVKMLLNNILNSTKPIIGDLLTQTDNREHTLRVLHKYTFIRYLFSSILFIPGAVLIDTFITVWLSRDYVLPIYITIIIATELFITIVHGSLVDYIAGLGYFSHDKKISIIGAILNITLSLLLVNKYGISGVLLGTVISQAFFWIARSIIVFKNYYYDVKNAFLFYWYRQFIYILLFSFNMFICFRFVLIMDINNSYLKFIIDGFSCLLIVISLNVILFRKTEEYIFAKSLIMKILNKLTRNTLARK